MLLFAARYASSRRMPRFEARVDACATPRRYAAAKSVVMRVADITLIIFR